VGGTNIKGRTVMSINGQNKKKVKGGFSMQGAKYIYNVHVISIDIEMIEFQGKTGHP